MTDFVVSMTFADWSARTTYSVGLTIEALRIMEDNYQKFLIALYANGASDLGLAQALGVTEAEIAKMHATLQAGHELYQAMTNVDVGADDRLLRFRDFA